MASRKPIVALSVLSFVALTAAPGIAQTTAPPQPPARTATGVTTRLTILVPEPDAKLVVDGKEVPGTGTTRTFETAASGGGTRRELAVTVEWRPNAYTVMKRTKTVSIRAGEEATVNLAVDDPNDRVRVIYAPTPPDVVEEMVKLAGVTSSDVVYEPGCGDARITMAAIRRGARRGICVDIDPERAEESRANVQKAGMQDKIDVRLGDALDVKNLTDITVVFLYMGEHFNLLIRPVLWRDLKVGSRIVSHRFLMGDWTPDRTVTVTTPDENLFDIHLWTVTEEVKRRLDTR